MYVGVQQKHLCTGKFPEEPQSQTFAFLDFGMSKLIVRRRLPFDAPLSKSQFISPRDIKTESTPSLSWAAILKLMCLNITQKSFLHCFQIS